MIAAEKTAGLCAAADRNKLQLELELTNFFGFLIVGLRLKLDDEHRSKNLDSQTREKGNTTRRNDQQLEKEIRCNLGYGKNSNPNIFLRLFLDKIKTVKLNYGTDCSPRKPENLIPR